MTESHQQAPIDTAVKRTVKPYEARPAYGFVSQDVQSEGSTVFDSPPESYEKTFKELLGDGETLASMCQELKQRHGYVLGADIMGGAGVFRTLPVDAAVGLTRKDLRPTDDTTLRMLDDAMHIQVVQGNVLRPASWRVRIARAVANLRKEVPQITGGINLMLIRPQGGAAGFPEEGDVGGFRGVTSPYVRGIAALAISQLRDGGTMLAEVPPGLMQHMGELQRQGASRGWQVRSAVNKTNALYPGIVRIDKPNLPNTGSPTPTRA